MNTEQEKFWHETPASMLPPHSMVDGIVAYDTKTYFTDAAKTSAEALRFDDNKTNWSLMPFEAVEEINKVLEFGAKKYAAWNFTKSGGMNHSRILNSCLRHIFSYMRGEDKDPESGLSHLAHAGCNILFLLYYKKYPEIFTKDDRHVR